MKAQVNWTIIIIVIIGGIALIAWLIVRNLKDEKEFEESENHIINKDDEEDNVY